MGKAGNTEEKKPGEEKTLEPGAPRSEAFRETFLFLFALEDAEVFRRIVDVVQDRLLERSSYEDRHPQHISFTLAEMLAVRADLSFLESFLRSVASERRLSDLTPTEQRLSELAGRLAPKVGALAKKLGQEVERLISDEVEKPKRKKTRAKR